MVILDIYNWLIRNPSVTLLFFSLGLALLFSLSAQKNTRKFQEALDLADLNIMSWQEKTMSSTVNTWDSLPQVIEFRTALAKVDAAQQLAQSIQEIVDNLESGASRYTQEQALIILTNQLESLLVSMSTR